MMPKVMTDCAVRLLARGGLATTKESWIPELTGLAELIPAGEVDAQPAAGVAVERQQRLGDQSLAVHADPRALSDTTHNQSVAHHVSKAHS